MRDFIKQFYVVADLRASPLEIERFATYKDAVSRYLQIPNSHLKALGIEKTPNPMPGSLDIVQCKDGVDIILEDYKKVPGWNNPQVYSVITSVSVILKCALLK